MIAGHHEHTVPVAAAVGHEIAIFWEVRATDVTGESQDRGHGLEDSLEWPRAELEVEVRCVLYTECGTGKSIHRARMVAFGHPASLFTMRPKDMPLP
jgi:hypothetical protein